MGIKLALDITYLLKKYAEMLEKGKTADGRRRGAAMLRKMIGAYTYMHIFVILHSTYNQI